MSEFNLQRSVGISASPTDTAPTRQLGNDWLGAPSLPSPSVSNENPTNPAAQGVDISKIGNLPPVYASDPGWGNGNIFQKLYTYGKALVEAPKAAIHDISTGQPIRTVTGGAPIVQRQDNLNNTGVKGIEVDHIMPLDLGGTNDLSNLQVQQGSANQTGTPTGNKDVVEQALGKQLSEGKISAKDAQAQMQAFIDANGGSKQVASTPTDNGILSTLASKFSKFSNAGHNLLTKTNAPVSNFLSGIPTSALSGLLGVGVAHSDEGQTAKQFAKTQQEKGTTAAKNELSQQENAKVANPTGNTSTAYTVGSTIGSIAPYFNPITGGITASNALLSSRTPTQAAGNAVNLLLASGIAEKAIAPLLENVTLVKNLNKLSALGLTGKDISKIGIENLNKPLPETGSAILQALKLPNIARGAAEGATFGAAGTVGQGSTNAQDIKTAAEHGAILGPLLGVAVGALSDLTNPNIHVSDVVNPNRSTNSNVPTPQTVVTPSEGINVHTPTPVSEGNRVILPTNDTTQGINTLPEPGSKVTPLAQDLAKLNNQTAVTDRLSKAGIQVDQPTVKAIVEQKSPMKIDQLIKDSQNATPTSNGFKVSTNPDTLTAQRDAAKKTYMSIGKSELMGNQPENAGLRILEAQAETPQGKEVAQKELSSQIESGNITPNKDGTITVYRGDEANPNANLVSVSTDKSLAAEHGAVTSYQVRPEDVAVAKGLDKGELLVAKEAISTVNNAPGQAKGLSPKDIANIDVQRQADLNKQRDEQIAIQQEEFAKKPAQTVREQLQQHVDSQSMKYEIAQEQRNQANTILNGDLNNLRRIINNAERLKSGLDVTKIPGLDEYAQMLRDHTGNQDLTLNDFVDYVKSIPTQAEINAMRPPKLSEPTEVKSKPSSSSTDIKPVKSTGDRSTPKLTERIAQETGQMFGDKYNKAILDENAKKAADLLENNLNRAIAIATVKEIMPNDVLGGSVYNAVKDYAQNNNDIQLLMDMRGFRRQSTRLGQEIKSLDNGSTSLDPVKAMTDIEDKRIEAAGGEAKVKAAVNEFVDKGMKETSKTSLKSTDVGSFFNGLRC